MNHHYLDIRRRIAQEPLWWDEYAVPRYDPFTPSAIANIYASECGLLKIACQNCERKFLVAMSTIDHTARSIRSLIETGEIHYGDPPNVDCCPSGPTMNSEPIRVVEFWHSVRFEWVRDPELERSLGARWAGGAL